MKYFFAIMLLLSVSAALDVEYYYKDGCPYCAFTDEVFTELSAVQPRHAV
jgi:hypothetical protein